ncbi:ABC transporter substrate-binding protein [Sneathiella sp. P13V-1]|uniref:penicillin-binding protein activator n=1 Tax=Sneathiella sp. P13V-1 TaxID=2697366 RepID=UPI00187B63EC|nr:penicillin-binding protein activator [Sneathiella sp. P13V-1]MBE7635789.1 ABC transporter substrate-binding protein [Sneathiella sp. P13V-1]
MRLKHSQTSKTTKLITSLFMCCLLGLSACQTVDFGGSNQAETPKPVETKKPEPDPKALEAEAMAREKAEAERLLAEQRKAAAEEQARLEAMPKGPSLSLRPPELTPKEQISRIAILLPLTGKYEKVGNDLLKAAYLALFDLRNEQLKLQPYDTKGTAEGALLATRAAIREGAEVILGPLFSDAVKSVRNEAAGRVNVIAFSTDITAAGSGAYLIGLTPQQQIERVMGFAYQQGISKFAVLAPTTPYGQTAVDSVRQTASQLGVFLTHINRYPADLPPGSEELHEYAKEIGNYEERQRQLQLAIKEVEDKEDDVSKAEYKRLKKLDTLGDVPFEAIIIPEGGQRLRELAPLLSYYDIDPLKVKYIGTGLWADRNLSTEPALVGGWFAAPSPEPSRQFLERFKATYGYYPPLISSLAYDAFALTGILASEGGEDKFSKLRLEDPDGFAGYNGIFRLLPNGLAQRGLAVMTIGQSELEVLEPAPDSFTPAIN